MIGCGLTELLSSARPVLCVKLSFVRFVLSLLTHFALHRYMDKSHCALAMIVKQRRRAGEIARMDLVGQVDGCDCILVDDMIDTAGTLCAAAEELKQAGARRVFAYVRAIFFFVFAFFRKKICIRIRVRIIRIIRIVRKVLFSYWYSHLQNS
jgi:hypothetical protein